MSERSGGRATDELRPVTIEPGFVRTATGSALISCGGTRVICTASVQESVPRWMAGRGTRLDDGRVRDAPRVHRRAQAARHLQGQAGRPRRRDPAPDRALAARRRRPRARSASARSTSTATSWRPTAAPAAPRSPAATSRSRWPAAASSSDGLLDAAPADRQHRRGLLRRRRRCPAARPRLSRGLDRRGRRERRHDRRGRPRRGPGHGRAHPALARPTSTSCSRSRRPASRACARRRKPPLA